MPEPRALFCQTPCVLPDNIALVQVVPQNRRRGQMVCALVWCQLSKWVAELQLILPEDPAARPADYGQPPDDFPACARQECAHYGYSQCQRQLRARARTI